MHPILRNILAVLAGAIIGAVVNSGIIMLSGQIIPPPPGANLTTTEGINAALPLMGPQHFIMPFLAHALGTLVGAMVAALIAVSHKLKFALGIGVLFLTGGIAACFMIPAPVWFIALDLLIAYIPMAYLGGRLAGAKQ